MSKETLKKRFLTAGLTRILLGLIISFLAFILAQKITTSILESISIDKNSRNLIKGIFSSLAILGTYSFIYKKIEKRTITELSIHHFGTNIVLGLALGIALQSFTILCIYFFGDIQIININSFSNLIIPFTVAFSVAIFEEIIMRGIIFRIVEEKWGSYNALFVSASIFSLLHLTNPNANIVSGICIFIAGLLFGIAYIYKRNLWFPIAIHFAWNFVQSGFFGAVTSGNEKTSSLLTTSFKGNKLITGGNFGPEASIQAVFICTITVFLLHQIIKNNNIQLISKVNRIT